MPDADPRRRVGGRWLITGAGGQLARSALRIAPARGVEAHGFARAELDIVDADAVKAALDRVQPDVVLNCAAFTGVDQCEEQTNEALRANVVGPEVLARACGSERLLVQISSDYVFDGGASRPIPEDARVAPLGAYGRTKAGGEDSVRDAGGDHLIVRTQWVFGPGPNFVRTILGAARQRPELQVVDDQIGRPTSSDALAEGIFDAVAVGARETLHLACEGVGSWYDLAVAAVREGALRGLCPAVAVRPVSSRAMPRPAPRPAYAVLGLERARALGINMPHWHQALLAYLDAEQEGSHA